MKRTCFLLCTALIAFSQHSMAQTDTTAHETTEIPEITKIGYVEDLKSGIHDGSYSLITAPAIIKSRINNITDFSFAVPNFYMPDYGSKGTASVFVRGVGSRMNEPAIGLYVDDIPYLDKHAFNFDFYDIQSILLLRGPQSTLYGRNSIGGLIRISTLSPLDFQGTRFNLSYGNRNTYRFTLSNYTKLTENLGFNFAFNNSGDNGFFENEFLGTYDSQRTRGARVKMDWKISETWAAQLTALYDQVLQNAFPYAYYDKIEHRPTVVAYNHQGIYNRDLANTGLLLSRSTEKTRFTSATGYQFLQDTLQMDQDYTIDSLFRLNQTQHQNSITQEFAWRSVGSGPYSWTVGAFGFVKRNDIHAPMTIESGMMHTIQARMDAAMDAVREDFPRTPFVNLGNGIFIPGRFTMSNYGFAVYHQSELKFFDRLTATAGLRLAAERVSLDFHTQAFLTATVTSPFIDTLVQHIVLTSLGKENEDFVHLTPKFSLSYQIANNAQVYATASQGKKSGGYNYSMFANVFQDKFADMKSSLQSDTLHIKESTIYYKPESLWNYEVGTHCSFFEKKLSIDAAAFFIRYSDMQIVSTLATNNGSRMIVNAGHTNNYGTEFSARWKLIETVLLHASHGYTNARFQDFVFDGNDYSGHYVPFIPRNSLSAGVDYTININKRLLNTIVLAAQYAYFTNVYFTERNNIQEKFYDLVNSSLTFTTKKLHYGAWVKNALNRDYILFYCESLGNGFAQQGRPIQFGFSLSAQF
ncbi:MAG: TonB-dependent receptor [Bacteroidales bacterium]|jgi:outer membrane receptor protein involved in Fe transport|nr:TonB-dependent receptor [Bacteroidales bacterium]